MSALFLVFNHDLSQDQEEDARRGLGVDTIHELPESLRKLWGQIPADAEALESIIQPLKDFLGENAGPGDYVLIQGDFGACFLMVNFCQKQDLVPVYATTVRDAVEETDSDGTVRLQHRFRHVRFRPYGQ